jgi:hypothetical protein
MCDSKLFLSFCLLNHLEVMLMYTFACMRCMLMLLSHTELPRMRAAVAESVRSKAHAQAALDAERGYKKRYNGKGASLLLRQVEEGVVSDMKAMVRKLTRICIRCSVYVSVCSTSVFYVVVNAITTTCTILICAVSMQA